MTPDPAPVAIFSLLLPLTKNVSNPNSWLFALFLTFFPSTAPSYKGNYNASSSAMSSSIIFIISGNAIELIPNKINPELEN